MNEISPLKSENERLKKIIEEVSMDISINYVKKAEHIKVVNELEQFIEDLKKDLDDKDEKFHQELMQKQKFFEEKFQRDVELIQSTTSRIKIYF